jgi:hypothetical protein
MISMFGKPGHGALERMAMQVRHARQGDAVNVFSRRRCGVGFDLGDKAVCMLQPHVLNPTAGQQRRFEKQASRILVLHHLLVQPPRRFVSPTRCNGFAIQKVFCFFFSKKKRLLP